MPSYADLRGTPLSGNDFLYFMCIGVSTRSNSCGSREQNSRWTHKRNAFAGKTVGASPPVYHSLDFNMRLGFKLQVSFFRLPGKISRKGFINIYRMGVMTFDKVAVIAVHGTNQIAHGLTHDGMQSPRKSAAFFGQIHSQIFQFPLSLGREHGFH